MKTSIVESLDLIFVITIMIVQMIIIATVGKLTILSSFRIYFIPMWLLLPCQLLGMLLEIKWDKKQ